MGLSDALLSQLGAFVASHTGLYFPETRRKDLERGLYSVAKEFGFDNAEACARWLISSTLTKDRIEVLSSHLTVGETYFFRDRKYFDALAGDVLSELVEARRKAGKYLRIWSAGCCTGEEPYSLAILLRRLIPDMEDWNITILATDINPAFLKKAETGLYGEWSFRDTPKWVREGYFRRTKGKRYELLPEIRNKVTFAYHNLGENSYPSLLTNTNAMDLILCRNVLMYLTPDHHKYVVRKFRQCLIEKGWMIVGPSEATDALFPGFASVNFQDVKFYKKGARDQGPGSMDRGIEPSVIHQEATISSAWPPPKSGGRDQDVQASIILRQALSPADVKLSPAAADGLAAQASATLYDEAFSLYEKGNYSGAEERLTPLLSQGRDEGKAAALLARIAANQGRLTDALSLCERAVSADRCDPSNYYLLATILQEQERLPEASAELRKALYLDQDFVLAHFMLGTLALRQGNKGEAEKHFRNARELLDRQRPEDLISSAEGMTAGRLMAMMRSGFIEETA